MRRRGARGETRFLTCSCVAGRRYLEGGEARRGIVREMDALVRDGSIDLHAWVVMGNHLHLLATPQCAQVERTLAVLKSNVARSVIGLRGDTHQIWERGGGFDRLVWSTRAYWSIFDYIHFNPVKAGLAATPIDWQWSSARDWERQRRDTPAVRHPDWVMA
ncbi:MAG: hypothetical protein LW636_12975 [Planctomycetaceae bacterium]|nr:hypothetical protein [Planctomycetaceae bacterium]